MVIASPTIRSSWTDARTARPEPSTIRTLRGRLESQPVTEALYLAAQQGRGGVAQDLPALGTQKQLGGVECDPQPSGGTVARSTS